MVDSGADITIMGGDLFKRVATVAKLRKKDFKPPDKVPRNYDQQPFQLDGRLDLDVSFQDKTMTTPVYVKMNAKEQLLLSEGVCCQLGILSYHPDVKPRKITKGDQPGAEGTARVPTVRVKLVQSARLPPNQSVVAEARLTDSDGHGGPLLIEAHEPLKRERGIQIIDSLVSTCDEDTV